MIVWLTDNIGTIIVSAVLLVVVALAVGKMISDKKKGRCSCGSCSSCGGNCAGCGMADGCQRKEE